VLHDIFGRHQVEPEFSMYQALAESAPVAGDKRRVMELGAGLGRLIFNWSPETFAVEGVENNPKILGTLEAKNRERVEPVLIHAADIREFEPQENYFLIYCPDVTFCMFSERELAVILPRLFGALLPGGIIAAEVMTLEYVPDDLSSYSGNFELPMSQQQEVVRLFNLGGANAIRASHGLRLRSEVPPVAFDFCCQLQAGDTEQPIWSEVTSGYFLRPSWLTSLVEQWNASGQSTALSWHPPWDVSESLPDLMPLQRSVFVLRKEPER
jgi:hypothetical protein